MKLIIIKKLIKLKKVIILSVKKSKNFSLNKLYLNKKNKIILKKCIKDKKNTKIKE